MPKDTHVVLTCEGPISIWVNMSTVVEHVRIKARPVLCLLGKEAFQLGLHKGLLQSTRREIATEDVDHVMREEMLDDMQEPKGAITGLFY